MATKKDTRRARNVTGPKAGWLASFMRRVDYLYGLKEGTPRLAHTETAVRLAYGVTEAKEDPARLEVAPGSALAQAIHSMNIALINFEKFGGPLKGDTVYSLGVLTTVARDIEKVLRSVRTRLDEIQVRRTA